MKRLLTAVTAAVCLASGAWAETVKDISGGSFATASSYTPPDGAVITGTVDHKFHLDVKDGYTITLRNVTIDGANLSGNDVTCPAVNCAGDATIILEGENTLSGLGSGCPGLCVRPGYTVEIIGDGKLVVKGNAGAPGIGGFSTSYDCGTIRIGGGGYCPTIVATGYRYSAGIGGSYEKSCGDIYIKSGNVTAQGGGEGGAGIGGGCYGSCGSIYIYGGTVKATGGYNAGTSTAAAGIGAGDANANVQSWCGPIEIGEGVEKVTAIAGTGAQPIGKGRSSNSSSGSVTVATGLLDNSIPNQMYITRTIEPWDGNLSTIPSIYTSVTAFDGTVISGTLPQNCKVMIAEGATVVLNGATINVPDSNQNTDDYKHAGITCLGNATIQLLGENVINGFYEDWPGIYIPDSYTLTIEDGGGLQPGTLRARSNRYGAGIGGGFGIDCGNIVIVGGRIYANGGTHAAGIGGGWGGKCGDIQINSGVSHIYADGYDTAPIGLGANTTGSANVTVADSLGDETRGNKREIAKPETATVDGIEWSYCVLFDEAQVFKTRYGAQYSAAIDFTLTGEITVPEKFGVYPVTSIGANAFRFCYYLTKVTLPTTVTSIGDYAFYRVGKNNTSFEVNIPSGVTSIGEAAFKGSYITSFDIPAGVTEIPAEVFDSCIRLTKVTMPKGLSSIGNKAFETNHKLDIWLLDSSFSEASLRTKLANSSHTMSKINIIWGGVETVGDYTWTYSYFNGNNNTVRASLDSVEPQPYGMLQIPTHIGGKIVQRLGAGLFENNEALTAAEMPWRLWYIGNNAFKGCSNLEQVSFVQMADAVDSSAPLAFSGCSKLSRVYIMQPSDGDTALLSKLGVDTQTARVYEEAGFQITGDNAVYFQMVDAPENTEGWQKCANLSSVEPAAGTVVIPAWVKNDEEYEIPGLPLWTIPENALNNASGGYSGITSVIIEDGVKTIGVNAFAFCSALGAVTIPDSVTTIGREAFYKTALDIVFVTPGKEATYRQKFAAALHDTDNILFQGWGAETDGDGRAWYYMVDEAGTEATIGNMLSGGFGPAVEPALAGDVTLPATLGGKPVKAIGNAAFISCEGLTGVTVPNGVKSIGAYAFANIPSLASVTIPASVTQFGGNIFENCGNVDVTYEGWNVKGADGVENVFHYIFAVDDFSATPLIDIALDGDDVIVKTPAPANTAGFSVGVKSSDKPDGTGGAATTQLDSYGWTAIKKPASAGKRFYRLEAAAL